MTSYAASHGCLGKMLLASSEGKGWIRSLFAGGIRRRSCLGKPIPIEMVNMPTV